MGPDEPCAGSPQSACADERATQWPQKSSSTVSGFCLETVWKVSDSRFSRFDPGAANVLEVLDFCTDSVGVSSALSRLFSMGWNGFDSRRLHHNSFYTNALRTAVLGAGAFPAKTSLGHAHLQFPLQVAQRTKNALAFGRGIPVRALRPPFRFRIHAVESRFTFHGRGQFDRPRGR